MGCKCKRYDAAGNPILPLEAMKLYYKDDPNALDILKSKMPFRYVVIPDIEIHIKLTQPGQARLYRIFPGATEDYDIELSERAVERCRWLYRRGGRWTHTSVGDFTCILKRKGTIVLDPLQRYGVKRLSA